MSKIAEQAAKETYKDGIKFVGRRDKNGNLIIHPEIMVGILRNACQRGYEQAEKDLALTWEDIAKIDALILEVNNEFAVDYSKEISREQFYTEVLNRFDKSKEVRK